MIEYIHLTILNSLKERFANLMDGKRLHTWFGCSGNKEMACHVRILDLRGKQKLHTKGMASFLIITTFSEILLESNPNSRTLKSGSLCICNTSWPASHYSLTIRSVISHVVPKLCSKEILSLQSNLADANSYPKNTKTTSHVLKKKKLE
jgi:hypothetical protein